MYNYIQLHPSTILIVDRFIEKNLLGPMPVSLSQDVALFLSVFAGCQFIGTRLSPHIFSNVACGQYSLEGLIETSIPSCT